jgi:MFS family permease
VQPPGQRHWSILPLTVITVTTLVQVVTVMAGNSMVVIAPALGNLLQVDPALIGFQVSFVYGGAMFAVIYGGRLVQRFGACRTQQICVGMSAIGALLAMVPNLWLLPVASILMGVGTGPATPAASHLLNRFTDPANRNLIFSLKQTGVPLGGMLAGAAAGAAVDFGLYPLDTIKARLQTASRWPPPHLATAPPCAAAAAAAAWAREVAGIYAAVTGRLGAHVPAAGVLFAVHETSKVLFLSFAVEPHTLQ